MENFKSNPFYYSVEGDYALFTDPMSKGGGEKYTYQIPTYQALVGITEAIYYKPTINIIVDEVKILNPISTETKGVRLLIDGKKKMNQDLSCYTYLKKVKYAIKFHFEWNLNYPELEQDRNEKKHQEIILRSLRRGGRRDIFLGTRECVGYIKKLNKEEYEGILVAEELKEKSISFGIMFHSFSYPNQSKDKLNYDYLVSNFTNTVVENGIVRFCRSEECMISRQLEKYSSKNFTMDNIKSVNEELKEIGE